MTINTNALVSITEANQNFSRVARMADEDVMALSKRLIEQNMEACEVLAK